MAVVTTNTSAAQLTSTAGIILLVPIGTASADRVVVVVIPDAQATTYTIGGVTAVPSANAIFFSALVPTGTTATVSSADASPFTLSGVWAITGGALAAPYASNGVFSGATAPYIIPANTALIAAVFDVGNTSSTLALTAGATADGTSFVVTSISATTLDGHQDYASASSGNITFTGAVATAAVFWAGYSATVPPVTTTVTATGASSHTFTSGDLPSGSGTLQLIEAWGPGASGNRRGHGPGGGAYASDNNSGAGWSITVGDTIYWNNPAGPAGTTTTSGAAPASDSWIRLNTNAAPTTTGQLAVLAKAGAPGTATADGAGGPTAASIGATKFVGGNGGNVGSGTTLRGGGGSCASSTGAGNNASGATGGATKAPDGGAGGAGTATATGGSGVAPGGGGGSTDSATGTGGPGARGQLRYTIQDGGGAPAVVTSPQGDIEGGIGDPGIGLPQQGLHAIEKGISAWRYEPMRKAA